MQNVDPKRRPSSDFDPPRHGEEPQGDRRGPQMWEIRRVRGQKSIEAGKSAQATPRKRTRTTLTPTVVAGLRRRIKAAPTKRLRKVAKKSSVPRESVRQVVKESSWRSLRKVKIPLISEEGCRRRRRRRSRSAGLLNKLKSGAPG